MHWSRSIAPLLAAVALGAIVFAGTRWTTRRASQHGDEVVATIAGRSIRMRDVEDRWRATSPDTFVRAQQQTYEATIRALDDLIAERLIEREAAREGIGVAELLARELPSRTPPVTDDRVKQMFDDTPNRPDGITYENSRSAIAAILTGRQDTDARRRYVDDLRAAAAAELTVHLAPPRQTIPVAAGDPTRGPDGAAVDIVEFSDFQCPYCRQLQPTLDRLLTKYAGKVRLVWKDFPLPNHPEAIPAAVAARCAGEQGRFWDYHDLVFANQATLSASTFVAVADQLHLGAAEFANCLGSMRYEGAIAASFEMARTYGVSATPTMFVNGRMMPGTLPFEAFDRVVAEELAAGDRRDGTARGRSFSELRGSDR